MDFASAANALLTRDARARRRGLALRTYAVLPLTEDCGIPQVLVIVFCFGVVCCV